MLVANIITGVACFLWGALALLGSSLAADVASRHIAGYPNAAQLTYYIGVPLGVAIVLGLVAIAFNRFRWPAGYLGALSAVALMALLPFLFLYAGGV